jgi:hypothetical protein
LTENCALIRTNLARLQNELVLRLNEADTFSRDQDSFALIPDFREFLAEAMAFLRVDP